MMISCSVSATGSYRIKKLTSRLQQLRRQRLRSRGSCSRTEWLTGGKYHCGSLWSALREVIGLVGREGRKRLGLTHTSSPLSLALSRHCSTFRAPPQQHLLLSQLTNSAAAHCSCPAPVPGSLVGLQLPSFSVLARFTLTRHRCRNTCAEGCVSLSVDLCCLRSIVGLL